MNKYCVCTDDHGNFLSRAVCPTCGLHKRLLIKPSVDIIPIVEKPKVVLHTIVGTLLEGVNIVKVLDVEYEAHEESISTLHKQERFPLNYIRERIMYSNPMGFDFNDPRFRPFRSGEVKGYIKNSKFYIIANVTNKRITDPVQEY
jgi:hypothetical protein